MVFSEREISKMIKKWKSFCFFFIVHTGVWFLNLNDEKYILLSAPDYEWFG